jgi:hypothetical protein
LPKFLRRDSIHTRITEGGRRNRRMEDDRRVERDFLLVGLARIMGYGG